MIDWRSLIATLAQRFGLKERFDWFEAIHEALRDLQEAHGCAHQEELIDRIHRDSQLAADLAARLTIGETHFLRHPYQFDYLTEVVQKRVYALYPGERITVWSAGCSTGEEPYSLAIALMRCLPLAFVDRVSIIATDINRQSIEHAERGVYRAWSFRGTPAWFLAGYFSPASDATQGCLLTYAVRRRVKFVHRALEDHLASLADESLDIVLFRNVALYLEIDAATRVYQQMHRILNQRTGLLLISPCDPPPPSHLFDRIDACGGVYRIPEATPRAADSPLVTREATLSFSRISEALPAAGARGAGVVAPGSERSDAAEPPALTRPDAVTALADRGELKQALRVANCLVHNEAETSAAYVLRGRLYLADGRTDKAVCDLRRAVFLERNDVLARFWYTMALKAAGRTQRTLKQVSVLRQQLVSMRADQLLDGGECSVAELQDAVELLAEGLE